MKLKVGCLCAGLLLSAIFPYAQAQAEDVLKNDFDINRRPQKDIYIFDYARILEDSWKYANNYLKMIRDRYAIEAVIVGLSSLPEAKTIEESAVAILNNWQIGKETGGRGVVLVLADKEKQVKLEVSSELEDVFTDIFCGYIEDKQLRTHFLGGQLNIGILAVMEELEIRAQTKHQGDYTKESIFRMDRDMLSMGAGAKRDLSKFEEEKIESAGQRYPAGNTPEEAWKTLTQSWRDKVRDHNLGVYTEIVKLIYRDYKNMPDSEFEENVRWYANKPYKIRQYENHAVVFFGNKDGWDNSPFLFCRDTEGWKFDMVYQRKYISMGANPKWGIQRTDHIYIDLLQSCPSWMNKDIPLEDADIYRIEDDQKLAEEIIRLEQEYKNNPDDFSIAMELGRLYTITSMVPKHFSVLNKAKQLNPENPLPYKYLAIAHVDANAQYKTALSELKEYVKRVPGDIFGRNFLGYLYFQTQEYEKAIDELKEALKLYPDNAYAYDKLSRCYGQLYIKALAVDLRRIIYKNSAIEMYNKLLDMAGSNYRRVVWLKGWLENKGILKDE